MVNMRPPQGQRSDACVQATNKGNTKNKEQTIEDKTRSKTNKTIMSSSAGNDPKRPKLKLHLLFLGLIATTWLYFGRSF